MLVARASLSRTDETSDLLDGCFGWGRFGGDAGIEVVGFEWLAAAPAIERGVRLEATGLR